MRIIDWISDVCSSDLKNSRIVETLAAAGSFFVPNARRTSASISVPLAFFAAFVTPFSLACLTAASSLTSSEEYHTGNSVWTVPIAIVICPAPVSLPAAPASQAHRVRSEEHTSELRSLMRISYAVFCLKKKKILTTQTHHDTSYITIITKHKIT